VSEARRACKRARAQYCPGERECRSCLYPSPAVLHCMISRPCDYYASVCLLNFCTVLRHYYRSVRPRLKKRNSKNDDVGQPGDGLISARPQAENIIIVFALPGIRYIISVDGEEGRDIFD